MLCLSIAAAWLLTYFGVVRYGVYVLPTSVTAHMTIGTYLALVQLLVTSIGLTLVVLASRRDPRLPWQLVPLRSKCSLTAPSASPATYLLKILLIAPTVYVVAHAAGMYLAYDTLLQELATRGLRAVQDQTGALGRSALLDSPWIILPFTVVVAPIGEELLFRGAVYGSLQALIPPALRQISDETAPSSLSIPGLVTNTPLRQRFDQWLGAGGGAWLGSSLIFGWMHADTPGGMGIVRLTSASVLGMACGYIRGKCGTVVGPIVLHAGYNLLALATLRGWAVSNAWPTKYALPTSYLLLSPLTLAAAWAITQATSARRGSGSSAGSAKDEP